MQVEARTRRVLLYPPSTIHFGCLPTWFVREASCETSFCLATNNSNTLAHCTSIEFILHNYSLVRRTSPQPHHETSPVCDKNDEHSMASEPAVEASQGPARKPLHFTDLPRELQQEIVSHVPQHDLICLCLVSRHFRDLAAAELYRNFNIIFPDDDDPAYDSPVDGLANGLETFATSDYDYAKHLRDVSLDTVSAGDKAELSYKHYLATQSCGKFMNTLILLMLRKAKALEKLRYVAFPLP